MKSQIGYSLEPHSADVRLIAAVQRHAGARCHESANLLHCYGLCAESYRQIVDQHDEAESRPALASLKQSEVNLRRFLWECRPDGN
jgi:hypothetical protein